MFNRVLMRHSKFFSNPRKRIYEKYFKVIYKNFHSRNLTSIMNHSYSGSVFTNKTFMFDVNKRYFAKKTKKSKQKREF